MRFSEILKKIKFADTGIIIFGIIYVEKEKHTIIQCRELSYALSTDMPKHFSKYILAYL